MEEIAMPLSASFNRKFKAEVRDVKIQKLTVGIDKQRSNVVASIDNHIGAYLDRQRSLNKEGNIKRVKRLSKPVIGEPNNIAIDLRYGATERIRLGEEDSGRYIIIPRSEERAYFTALREAVINGDLDDEIEDAIDIETNQAIN